MTTARLTALTLCVPMLIGSISLAGPSASAVDTATSRPARRAWMGRRRQLSQEETQKLLDFAKQYMPDVAKRLEELVKTNSPRAMPMLRHVQGFQRYVSQYPEDVREAAIKSYRIRLALVKFSVEHAHADDSGKPALVAKMRELLDEQFDYDLTVRAYDVKRVAKHIEDIQAEIKRRKAERKQLIAEKLKKILEAPGPKPVGEGRRPGPGGPAPDASFRAPDPAPTGGPGNGGRRRFARRRRKLTEAEIAEILAFAKKHLPAEVYAQLEKLAKEEPTKADPLLRHLQRLQGRVKDYPDDVARAFMTGRQINIELLRARMAYAGETDAGKKKALAARLKELLTKQFDADLIVKSYDVKRLGKRLAELKAELERRKAEQKSIIAEKLQKLLEARPRPEGYGRLRGPRPATRPVR